MPAPFYHRFILLLTCALLLPACSLFETRQPPVSNLTYDWPSLQAQLTAQSRWRIMGKIGVRTPEDSMSAAINEWTQINDVYDVHLSSTFLGLGSARLRGNAAFVTLEESGEEPVSSDYPELLIEQSLGFPLPLGHLQYWIKGLPAPGTFHLHADPETGLPKRIEQFGWTLEYSKHMQSSGLPMPGKIKLSRGPIRIILAIKEWQLL